MESDEVCVFTVKVNQASHEYYQRNLFSTFPCNNKKRHKQNRTLLFLNVDFI